MQPDAELAKTFAHLARSFEGADPRAMLTLLLQAASRPSAPSDDEIVQRSRDLIEAVDRGDVPAVDAALAPAFLQFEGGPSTDRDRLLAKTARKSARIASRDWDRESVVRKDDVLVFTGRARETERGSTTHGAYYYVGWFLLQWVRVGAEWRVQLWTWQPETNERDAWNDVFRHGQGFSREPNRLLVDTINNEPPGAALDVAMGHGRNALYLASRGWRVTGVDGSDEALRIARDEAAKQGLALETVNANIDEWDFGTDRFDLVTLTYAGEHGRWLEKIKASLRPGGVVVIEGWSKVSPDSEIGFATGQPATMFDGFEILRDEIVEDVPDWVHDKGKLLRFVARKRS